MDIGIIGLVVGAGAVAAAAAGARASRARAEALRVELARLAEVMEHAPVALLVCDAATLRVEHANRRARTMFGRSLDDMRRQSGGALIHHADREAAAAQARALADGYIDELEVQRRYLRPDGSEFPCECHVAALKNADGAPTRLVAFAMEFRAREVC